MNHNSESSSDQPAQAGKALGGPHSPAQMLAWSKGVLRLDVPADAELETIQAAALESYFFRLTTDNFCPDPRMIEAVDVIFGQPPTPGSALQHSMERQQMESIDEIVQWYSTQLGETQSRILLSELRRRLSPFRLYSTPASPQNYAAQVQLAAEVAVSPLDEANSIARHLAQAVFHIAAIRNSQRRITRERYVGRFQDQYSQSELNAAVKAVKLDYRLPNDKFHQPFLRMLTWDVEQTANVRIGGPVSADTQSVIAYSRDFGRPDHRSGQNSTAGSWGWVIFAVVFGAIGFLLSLIQNLPKPNPPRDSISATKVPVIVFDSVDPNKYAVEFRVLRSVIGRRQDLTPTPEHPGPFVKVPLSEINRDKSSQNKTQVMPTLSYEALKMRNHPLRNGLVDDLEETLEENGGSDND